MTWTRARSHSKFSCKSSYWKKYFVICACFALLLLYVHYDSRLIEFTVSTSVRFEDIRDANQSDPNLIKFLRDNVITLPSGQKYNLTHPEKDDFSQSKQGLFLRDYFRDKKNGTFIEAGAWDGEYLSNTLILERQLGWTGLLIEPNPQRYPKILEKHRKVYTSKSCISISVKPAELNISLDERVSHIIGFFDLKNHPKVAKVNCFPLYSLMAAVNMTSLDFLSLDLESMEVKVLETIPWEKVAIKSLLIEVNHIPEGKEYIKDFMAKRNYVLEKELRIDYFFVKIK